MSSTINVKSHAITFQKDTSTATTFDVIEVALSFDHAELDLEHSHRVLIEDRARAEEDEDIDFSILTKLVSLINRYNNNIIKKFDYTVQDDAHCTVLFLFSHILKKKNVSQKYAYYDVVFNREERKVIFNKKTGKENPFFKLKEEVEFLPIKNVFLRYEVVDRSSLVFKLYYSKTATATDDGSVVSELVQEMFEAMFESCFEHLDKHVSIRDGRIQIVE